MVVADVLTASPKSNAQPTTVYVVDSGNNAIRPINSLGVVFAPTAGVPSGTKAPAGSPSTTFTQLVHLAADPASNLLLATDGESGTGSGAGKVYRVTLS